MKPVLSAAAVVEHARRVRPTLIGVDGYPCSGKSTLTAALCRALGGRSLALDDFILPECRWPARDVPAFPFQYVRYDEFLSAVRALATDGACSFSPYDWEKDEISAQVTLTTKTPLVVEGVSALCAQLAKLYDLRVFVASDQSSVQQALTTRNGAKWAEYWRTLFLPSVDLYMRTLPEERADIIAAGRGVGPASADASAAAG